MVAICPRATKSRSCRLGASTALGMEEGGGGRRQWRWHCIGGSAVDKRQEKKKKEREGVGGDRRLPGGPAAGQKMHVQRQNPIHRGWRGDARHNYRDAQTKYSLWGTHWVLLFVRRAPKPAQTAFWAPGWGCSNALVYGCCGKSSVLLVCLANSFTI
jgi:hypothetical protein